MASERARELLKEQMHSLDCPERISVGFCNCSTKRALAAIDAALSSARNDALEACTCGEIAGENPNCPLHGETDAEAFVRKVATLRIGEYETSDADLRRIFFACRNEAIKIVAALKEDPAP